jgi:hypothetical protein
VEESTTNIVAGRYDLQRRGAKAEKRTPTAMAMVHPHLAGTGLSETT